MSTEITAHRSKLAVVARFAIVAYCYIVMSGLVTFFVCMKTPVLESSVRASTVSMVDGTANKPFVYRRLLPAAAGAIYAMLPESVDSVLTQKAKAPGAQSVITFLQWREDYLAYYLIVAGLMFACFLGFMVSLRWIARLCRPNEPLLCDMAPVLAMLLLPPTFMFAKYIYDPATLLLFALAFGAILARKDYAYYPIFIAAAFNKETAILLVPLFVMVYWGKRGKLGLSVHALAQVAIWAGVSLWLRHIYGANPGVAVEHHLLDHNLAFGYMGQKMLAVAYVLLLAIVARFGWSSSSFTRRALIVTLAPLVVLTLCFGWVEELRDYLEAMPMLFTLLIPGVRNLYHQ